MPDTMTCRGGGRSDLGGEIVTIADLDRQAETADTLLEQLELMTRIARDWAQELPDRLRTAAWHVEAVTAAAEHVTEAAEDLTALQENVTGLRSAIADAQHVGADAGAAQAEGQAEGLFRD